jgi:hypothetical protein
MAARQTSLKSVELARMQQLGSIGSKAQSFMRNIMEHILLRLAARKLGKSISPQCIAQ